MNENLVVLDPVVRRDGLQVPPSARGIVVIAHLAPSPQCCGHRFLADVLRANGLATLLVSLHTPEEQRLGQAAPGQVLIKRRLRAVFDWLAIQQGTNPLPVALLAIDGAVRACVATAARCRPTALRTLILLDGRPYQSHLWPGCRSRRCCWRGRRRRRRGEVPCRAAADGRARPCRTVGHGHVAQTCPGAHQAIARRGDPLARQDAGSAAASRGSGRRWRRHAESAGAGRGKRRRLSAQRLSCRSSPGAVAAAPNPAVTAMAARHPA